MSWNLEVVVPAETEPQDVADLITAAQVTGNEDCAAERDLAIEVAAEAVSDIIESGILGNEKFEIVVSMGGHVNPGHKPREGWSDDFINISLGQRTPAPAAATEEAGEPPALPGDADTELNTNFSSEAEPVQSPDSGVPSGPGGVSSESAPEVGE